MRKSIKLLLNKYSLVPPSLRSAAGSNTPINEMNIDLGYFPGSEGTAPIQFNNGKTIFLNSNPWRLDVAPGSFFGVEENIFRGVCAMGRAGDRASGQVNRFPDIPPFYSGISLLRDGSIIGPVEFFNPVGVSVF